MRFNYLTNTLASISATALSFLVEALPLLQLIAVLIAIVSGGGAIHLTILKLKLLRKQIKDQRK